MQRSSPFLNELLAPPVSRLILARSGRFLALSPSSGFVQLEKKVGWLLRLFFFLEKWACKKSLCGSLLLAPGVSCWMYSAL